MDATTEAVLSADTTTSQKPTARSAPTDRLGSTRIQLNQQGAPRARHPRRALLRALTLCAILPIALTGCQSSTEADIPVLPSAPVPEDSELWSSSEELGEPGEFTTPEGTSSSSDPLGSRVGEDSAGVDQAPQQNLSSAQAVNPEYLPTEQSPSGSALSGQYLTREASLTLSTADPKAHSASVHSIVSEHKGTIDSQTVDAATEYSGANASFTIRVPVEHLTPTLEALGKLGSTVSLQQSTWDVSTQVVDTEARVTSLQDSLRQLEQLRDSASSTADLLQAEAAISTRQAELAGLEAQLAALTDRVDQATIWLNLTTPEQSPTPASGGFWGDILRGLQSILTVALGTVSLIGFLLPWLALLGIIVSVLILIRRLRRKRAQSHHDTQGPAPFRPTAQDSKPGSPAGAPLRSDSPSQTPAASPASANSEAESSLAQSTQPPMQPDAANKTQDPQEPGRTRETPDV